MIAVIMTGGKQYTVKIGDTLSVEKLEDAVDGATLTFDQVLLVGNPDGTDTTVGTPTVKGATVEATVVQAAGRGKKIEVRKFKAKTRYFKRYGHRQPFTEVKITKINA